MGLETPRGKAGVVECMVAMERREWGLASLNGVFCRLGGREGEGE